VAVVAVTRKALGMPGRATPSVRGRGNFAQRVLQQRTSTNASSPRRKMRRSGTTRTSSDEERDPRIDEHATYQACVLTNARYFQGKALLTPKNKEGPRYLQVRTREG